MGLTDDLDTVIGRTSGQRRTSHLIARPRGRPARHEIFARAASYCAGYRSHLTRIGGSRRIRVFVLEPVSAA